MRSSVVTHADILEELRNIKLPADKRIGVNNTQAKAEKKGCVIGYIIDYLGGWTIARFTRRFPCLALLACEYARQEFPSFNFTSIMVNMGGCCLHVDSKNCGNSLLLSVGDHVGGQLWQYPGQVLDAHNTLTSCDGRLPHITLPFEGERYSLVFFNLKGDRAGPSREASTYLSHLGFWHPSHRKPQESSPARKDLMDSAAKLLRSEWGLSMKYIGNYKNNPKKCHNMDKTEDIRRRIKLSRRKTRSM